MDGARRTWRRDESRGDGTLTILLYAQDSKGMGHVTRNLTIARHLLAAYPNAVAFIATESQDVEVGLLSLHDDKTRSIFSQREWIGGLAWTADGQSLVLSLNHHGTRRLMKLPIKLSGAAPELLSIGGEDAY